MEIYVIAIAFTIDTQSQPARRFSEWRYYLKEITETFLFLDLQEYFQLHTNVSNAVTALCFLILPL